jgi:hypothetical protein
MDSRDPTRGPAVALAAIMTRADRSFLFSLLGVAWLALAASSSGCAPGGGSDDVAAEEEALTSPPTWDAPSCSESALVSESNVCGGPWTFTKADTAVGRNPYCAVKDPNVCKTNGTCLAWNNGFTVQTTSEPSADSLSITCTENCHWVNGEGWICSPENCTSPNSYSAAVCTQQAASLQTQRRNSINTELLANQPPLTAAVRNNILTSMTMAGSYTHQQISNHVVISSNGHYKTTTRVDRYSCTYAVHTPAKANGQGPWCPCAEQDWVVCEYPTGTSTTQYTLPTSTMPAGPWITNVSCTTCDTRPVTTPDDVNQKYLCLTGAASAPPPATISAAQWLNALNARLELLFQFRADALTDPQRQHILDIYDANTAPPTCDLLELSEACKPVSDAAGLTNQLRSCLRTSGTYTPIGVVDSKLPACLGLLDTVAGLTDACKPELREVAARVAEAVVARRFDAISFSGGGWAGLVEALNAIDAWYDHAKVASADDPVWLRGRTSILLGALWKRVYAAQSPAPQTVASSGTDAQTVLNKLVSEGLVADWAVLDAAFGQTTTLDSPPLLAIVADALRGSFDRLDTVSQLHDIGCRYKICTSGTDSTMTSQTWRVLAGIVDGDTLLAALTGATLLKTAHLPLWNALVSLRLHRDRLQAAYTAAGGGDLSTIFDGGVPADGEALASVLGGARERWQRYTKNGRFLSDGLRPLYAGVQNKSLVVSGIGTHETALVGAISGYVNGKINTVNALLAQMRGEQEVASLISRLQVLGRHIVDVTSDMNGLQAREVEERRRYADYVKAFDALHSSGVFDDNLAAHTTPVPLVQLSGGDARFPGGSFDVLTAAVPTSASWPQVLHKGESLRFTVTGEWAPTCSLQLANVPNPADGTYHNLATDAHAGPEGYMMTWTDSNFRAAGWSNQDAIRGSVSVEACLQVGFDLGLFGSVTGSKVEAYVKACAGLDVSHTHDESQSGGSELRSSASFSGGIHLDTTPFPDAPAGALLMVLTEHGNAGHVLGVEVVNRQGSYLASADVDAYLVVNDRYDTTRCTFRRNDLLSVEAVKTTSFGAVAQQLKLAMAETIGLIEDQTPALLRQGQLLGSDATLLRQEAHQTLATLMSLDVTQLPAAVMEFYDTWITAELSSLERRTTLRQLQREMDRAFFEIDSLQSDVAAAGSQSRLLALIPRWTLRNLQADRLDVEVHDMVRLLNDYVPPVFELRYTKALTTLRSKPNNKVTPLLALDFAAPTEDAYAALDALALDVRDTIEFAQLDSADYGTSMVAIGFLNAEWTGWSTCGELGCPGAIWKTVDATRARAVWDKLRARQPASFTIYPDDLYDRHGRAASLLCSQSAPVVRRVALVPVGSLSYGDYHYHPSLTVSADQSFPTPQGVQDYVKVDEDWLTMGLPVLGRGNLGSGGEADVVNTFAADSSHVGEGLSPFGTFEVDFTNWPFAGDTSQTELVLVMEVETRPVALPGVAVDACSP